MSDNKPKFDWDLHHYDAFIKDFNDYKVNEQSKISYFFYGLIAIVIYALFQPEHDHEKFAKYILLYSILLTLAGYFFWYLADMVIQHKAGCYRALLTLRNKRQALEEERKELFLQYQKNSSSAEIISALDINHKNWLDTWYYQQSNSLTHNNIERFEKKLAWLSFVFTILAAILVLLGLFWLVFPISLEQNLAGTANYFHSFFYFSVIAIGWLVFHFKLRYYACSVSYNTVKEQQEKHKEQNEKEVVN